VVTTTAFANFGQALLAPSSSAALSNASTGATYAPPSAASNTSLGGGSGGSGGATAAVAERAAVGVRAQTVDYSAHPMSGERVGLGCGTTRQGRDGQCSAVQAMTAAILLCCLARWAAWQRHTLPAAEAGMGRSLGPPLC
jgi:hypothetical protein